VISETGKRRAEAEAEVAWTATSLRWYGGHPPVSRSVDNVAIHRRPVGVVAAITPWNVPLVTPVWKLAPALMAGNAVVWKPSELATACALALSDCLTAGGVPDEVLHTTPGGAHAGDALCRDDGVHAVVFTGSTAAGRSIARAVAERLIPYSLELGGSNPAIVFEDADLDRAADDIVATVASLQGQKCTTTRRVLAAARVADELESELRRRIEALRMGDPRDPETTLGPLITPEAADRAKRAIAAARSRGATIAAESSLAEPRLPDTFCPATLIRGLALDDPLWHEELFAPVLALRSFDEPETAWDLANDTPFGLSAAVYTASSDLMRRAGERVMSGTLVINGRSDHAQLDAPFGGRKLSGHGAPEGGLFAYDATSEYQAVYDLSPTG
jgi:aldehyde dehydrogenase (NAD+)